MKAMAITHYGTPEVFELQDRPRPELKVNDILVRVYASSVNYGDLVARDFGRLKARDFNMPGLLWLAAKAAFGFSKPRVTILGSEFSGSVEAVGSGVSGFRPGDLVFGTTAEALGAYAEFVRIPASGAIAAKPSMSHEDAATVTYGATTALALLKPLGLKSGQKLLVVGASGSIGAAAVQIAKAWGIRVTGVCGPRRLDYVRALGADSVIDYTHEDYASGGPYDVVFDVLGKGNFSRVKKALNPGGRYLVAGFKSRKLLQMLGTSFFGDKKLICGLAPTSAASLLEVRALIEAGKFRAIVDRVFPLQEMADAHRYAEAGSRIGAIAISVASS